MVMVCFSAIIKRKPPWAGASLASPHNRQRATTGGLPSTPEGFAADVFAVERLAEELLAGMESKGTGVAGQRQSRGGCLLDRCGSRPQLMW